MVQKSLKIVVFALLLVVTGLPGCRRPASPQIDNPHQPGNTANTSRVEKPANWQYHEVTDAMGRGNIKMAITTSTNMVSFGFPYEGMQRGEFTLRLHPEYGEEALFKIEKGQFLASAGSCKVLVRLDDQRPESISCTEPADHKTTMIFISGYDVRKLLPVMKNSKKMKIEASFYQEGPRIFEFDIEGLNWTSANATNSNRANSNTRY